MSGSSGIFKNTKYKTIPLKEYNDLVKTLKKIAGLVCDQNVKCERCKYMEDTICMYETKLAEAVLKKYNLND